MIHGKPLLVPDIFPPVGLSLQLHTVRTIPTYLDGKYFTPIVSVLLMEYMLHVMKFKSFILASIANRWAICMHASFCW